MKVERVGRKTNQSQKKRYWLTDQTNQRALKSKQALMTSWTNHKRVLRVCPSYKEFWSIWINWKRFWSIKTNCKTSEASKKGIFKRATVLNFLIWEKEAFLIYQVVYMKSHKSNDLPQLPWQWPARAINKESKSSITALNPYHCNQSEQIRENFKK